MGNKKKIRILMVAGHMNDGGIENQLMHLARNADRDRFRIDFTSTDPNAYYRNEIESLGCGFILIPKMDWSRPLVYCRALYKVMREGHYDVVHSHELFHSGIVILIAFFAGVPGRFVHAHNWNDDETIRGKRSLARIIYNKMMQILVNSFSTTQIACSSWAGEFLFGSRKMRSKSFHIVHNSVDTTRFLDHYGEKGSGEFSSKDGWANVLSAGRFTAVKNQKYLVRVALELKKRGDRITILCAGTGDQQYMREIRGMIEKKHLGSYIKLLGVRSDIDVLMREAKAFVLPSKFEGMPLVMIEAQASGLPCISADTYSHEVDFGIGSIQWMAPGADIADWADAIEQAVVKERPQKEIVEKAVAKGEFDSIMFTKKICRLYQEG